MSTVFFAYWVYCAWGEAIATVRNSIDKAKALLKSRKRRRRGNKGNAVAPSDRTDMYAVDADAAEAARGDADTGSAPTPSPVKAAGGGNVVETAARDSAGFSIVSDDGDDDGAPTARPLQAFASGPEPAAPDTPGVPMAGDGGLPESKAPPNDASATAGKRRTRANFSGPVTSHSAGFDIEGDGELDSDDPQDVQANPCVCRSLPPWRLGCGR